MGWLYGLSERDTHPVSSSQSDGVLSTVPDERSAWLKLASSLGLPDEALAQMSE